VEVHTLTMADGLGRTMARSSATVRGLQRIVAEVDPDLVHSHFAAMALLARLALRRHRAVPHVFQVPGPLHLEHPFFARIDVGSAGPHDRWIASSRYVQRKLAAAGAPSAKVYLSYYGTDVGEFEGGRTGFLRARYPVADGGFLVGSVSFMYPPKRYLGQSVGIKCHEDVIAAVANVGRRSPTVSAIIAGEAWQGAEWYKRKLERLAAPTTGIQFAGGLSYREAVRAWGDFDCVLHVPFSENCGGVVEPLLAGVPVIASTAGGLPEVIFPGLTGILVPPRRPDLLAAAILEASEDLEGIDSLGKRGQKLAREMFDVRRTGREVRAIYDHILGESNILPVPYDSRSRLLSFTDSRLSP